MVTEQEKLVVIWSSADREVALKMAFLYTLNSKLNGWWEDITFIVWGPSASLLAQDYELQEQIFIMKENGIKLEACKVCSDSYGVSEKLEAMGIDVRLMGTPLTDYLKDGRKVISF